MSFQIGQTVELNGKEYEITGTYKRSFILEKDGKKYKAGPAKLNAILNQEPITRPARKSGSRIDYLEQRLKYNQIWNKSAKMPETETEFKAWFSQIESDLSPENLHCDGEISRTAAMKKYRALNAEWKQLEKLYGKKVEQNY